MALTHARGACNGSRSTTKGRRAEPWQSKGLQEGREEEPAAPTRPLPSPLCFGLPWTQHKQALTREWLQFVLSAEIYLKCHSPGPFLKQFAVQPGWEEP